MKLTLELTLCGKDYFFVKKGTALSNEYELRDQNVTKTYTSGKMFVRECRVTSRNQGLFPQRQGRERRELGAHSVEYIMKQRGLTLLVGSSNGQSSTE